MSKVGVRGTPRERFHRKYEVQGDCWVWTAATNLRYGWFSSDHATTLAHRFAYEEFVGEIPPGMDIDHLCRNRLCVNPAHLEPVTRQENLRRGLNGKLKTHCAHGHEWNDENVYRRSNGSAYCVICHRANVRRRYYHGREQ